MEEIEEAKFEEITENQKLEDTTEGQASAITEEDIRKMWAKLHTPIKCVTRMPGRNEICPFCNSGKKFKNCTCYKERENIYEYDYSKTKPLYV